MKNNAITNALPPPPTTATDLTAVCILIPATSAKQAQWSALEHTYLHRYALSSIARTIDISDDDNKYAYQIFIGYDEGDALFDNETTIQALHQWAADQTPPTALLSVLPVPNPLHKPGPAMNYLSREAHTTGCDYLYRINDDTELLTPKWARAFIATLASFSPPNIGVVGPTCHEGNTAILTHDFVHRSHLDIFGSHYPAELTDWWLDDWISRVYGPRNTRKLADVVVRHHVESTRYEVSWASQQRLEALVWEGNRTLAEFVAFMGWKEYIR